VQRRRNVDFQQPRLEVRVQQNIETKEFEAGIAIRDIIFQHVVEGWCDTQQSFNHNISQRGFDGFDIDTQAEKVGPQALQSPVIDTQVIK
jgi:hypothetical protein